MSCLSSTSLAGSEITQCKRRLTSVDLGQVRGKFSKMTTQLKCTDGVAEGKTRIVSINLITDNK